MKKKISFLILIIIIQIISAEPTRPWEIPYQIEGLWIIMDDVTKLEVGKVNISVHNDTLYSVIQEIYGKKRGGIPLCTLCVDSLKDKPIEGMRILWGFVQSDRTWKKGRMLDIQDGKIYRAELELSPDESELVIFSYVRRIIKIGRTQRWIKVETDQKK